MGAHIGDRQIHDVEEFCILGVLAALVGNFSASWSFKYVGLFCIAFVSSFIGLRSLVSAFHAV